ncbi:hypothetical protein [Beggiatoa leptomitoformis]|uniref:DUF4282 domain-containing protein n=1 Tax=Beggiatoa leptomitoformis TaxID=288004 RepID=A0A2N9YF15_9GAMM|nr:hypothetical protein [Beggiatoa leptomitoformis]ALG68628.1 hypothetical protein AL038_14090 [Beggiatoa leptomitoformis]AUI69026.1 hypothetical protein BLE401_10165 [Beggiatoa leptomitoformis]
MSATSSSFKHYILLGLGLTFFWLFSILFMLELDLRLLQIMTPSELGNVIYVLSAPLVFMWLAIGYLQIMDDYKKMQKELVILRQMFTDLKQRLDKMSD